MFEYNIGNLMSFNLLSLAKTEIPIVVADSGIKICSNFKHAENALYPKYVTESAILI